MTHRVNSNSSTVLRQRTLKTSINCSGIALHSGEKVSITLNPGEINSGIIFKRTDISGKGALIPARYDHVVNTQMCTVIGNDQGVSIGTVEHLMAALAGCGIDNALIEINGPEVPVMDGSSAPFVFLLECAGIVDQDAPRRAIRVNAPISITENNKFAGFDCANGFSIDFAIDFDNPAINAQDRTVQFAPGTFKKDVCRARTFGFMHEVEALRNMGLARGGSLENAIVISGGKVLNEEGLRFDDEFVRHKILDAVGDLALAGMPILGHFTARASGHALNNKLLHKMFADKASYSIVEMTEADLYCDIPKAALKSA